MLVTLAIRVSLGWYEYDTGPTGTYSQWILQADLLRLSFIISCICA